MLEIKDYIRDRVDDRRCQLVFFYLTQNHLLLTGTYYSISNAFKQNAFIDRITFFCYHEDKKRIIAFGRAVSPD